MINFRSANIVSIFLAEGEGFKLAMNILNNGRFGIPAVCTGSMKFCIQKTVMFK